MISGFLSSHPMAPTITKDTPVVQLHTKTHFPIKLISTNFSIWQCQVSSTLIEFVDGTFHAPPKVLEGAANPCYSIWFRQDQSIIGALLGSCSDQVQPLITTCETACEAWTNLHAAFANSSRSHIVSFKSQLGKNPKGDRSMSDYLFDMQSIANELALVQSPVSEEDLVVHVLNQVGDEYDSITSVARVRANLMPLSLSIIRMALFFMAYNNNNNNNPVKSHKSRVWGGCVYADLAPTRK
ncbi:unnamed protein product [Cuscuta campestris]|uniref:Retrotransposon Copia-like N-terminal domain-containing protein n=1 Tax=Cuscuta campestris TaxID=132261 RepID=A0A484NDX4_9ASTE|nr:unnamed protein product [Cuscuta campestris]